MLGINSYGCCPLGSNFGFRNGLYSVSPGSRSFTPVTDQVVTKILMVRFLVQSVFLVMILFQ